MTVKVDRSGLDRKMKGLKLLMKKMNSKSTLSSIGEFAVDTIYKRTKSGSGVDDDKSSSPKRKKLNPLTSKPYIKKRKKSKLGPFGTPRKSNLTFTGQMLENLFYKIVGSKVTVSVKNSPRSDSKSTNKKVSEYVSEAGRPFLALAKKEQGLLTKKVKDMVRKITRSFS